MKTKKGIIHVRNRDGHIYPITYTATDFSGNTSTASATVTVPHDVGEKRKQN